MKNLFWVKEKLQNPKNAFWTVFGPFLKKCINDDKLYIKIRWKFSEMPYPLNLDIPRTFNEKQNWLKLYDRKPEYTMMVDKYLVKSYVASIIGSQYIIPTIGVWDNPEEIDFDLLPDKFVLKCNHNSGTGMVICKDRSKLDLKAVRDGLKRGLCEDYFLHNREWPYKDVPRKIIAEQFMEDKETKELRDYKFFCFNGEVKALFIATDRSKGDHATRFDFFDENFKHLPFTNGHPNANVLPSKPKCFDEMKRIAAILSRDLPSARIDLYEINGKVYFGEITFTHWGGYKPFVPGSWDEIFGDWIKLPSVH